MRRTPPVLLAVVAAVIALAAAPGFAVDDLTGTYEGFQSCKGVDGTPVKAAFKCCDVLEITQWIAGELHMRTGGLEYFGKVVEPLDKPDQGSLTAIACSTSTALTTAVSEMGHFQVTSDVPKASIKGSSVFTDAAGQQFLCKWSYKRVVFDFPLPHVPPCD
jgi:hypothetical protein